MLNKQDSCTLHLTTRFHLTARCHLTTRCPLTTRCHVMTIFNLTTRCHLFKRQYFVKVTPLISCLSLFQFKDIQVIFFYFSILLEVLDLQRLIQILFLLFNLAHTKVRKARRPHMKSSTPNKKRKISQPSLYEPETLELSSLIYLSLLIMKQIVQNVLNRF